MSEVLDELTQEGEDAAVKGDEFSFQNEMVEKNFPVVGIGKALRTVMSTEDNRAGCSDVTIKSSPVNGTNKKSLTWQISGQKAGWMLISNARNNHFLLLKNIFRIKI